MKCAYFTGKKCNSCNLLNIDYEDTLILKENSLKEFFPNHTHLIKPSIKLTTDAIESRSKAKLAFFTQANRMVLGFYNNRQIPTELEHCPLHAAGINDLLSGIKHILIEYKLSAYDLYSKTGELKYLLISSNNDTESPEILLRFVLRSKEQINRLKAAIPKIKAISQTIKVITANIQPIHQAIIEGDEEIILTNESTIIHQFDEFKLALGARSFFQVTPEIAKKLYHSVAQAVRMDAPKSFIDLYCGVGAFSFYASRYCADITGVEISKEAIDCANYSNKLNGTKINFQALDVEIFLKSTRKKFDALLINPPRRGLNSSIISMITNLSPQFIYYSSCNAQTMQRDFLELKDLYEINSLQIFDMFPYTNHYETLMCLKIKRLIL